MKLQLKESCADALKYIWIMMTILSGVFTKVYLLDGTIRGFKGK
jgi:hypothetical protein